MTNTALFETHFITKATPINNIDSKCHNKETVKHQELFDWLLSLHFTLMVFHNLGDGRTSTDACTHVCFLDKSNF